MGHEGDALRDGYRRRFEGTERYRDQVWKVLCDGYFGSLVPPDASVLDLGCGWGEFINNIEASERYAMDLNGDARHRLSSGTRFLHQDSAERWPLASGSLDVIFTSNFLEHLPDKDHVARTIAEAHRCLRPEGLIICLGPNIRYVRGAYWDFWDHFVPMTERSLGEVLELHGFEVRSSIPRFLPYSMSTGRTPPLFLVKLYLRLPPVWRLLGKQFLVVAARSSPAA